MPNLGVPELIIIFLIVLLIFGYSRLPELGKGLGEGIRNFRRGLKGDSKPEDRSQDGSGSE
jgi:sec-independent protein translocase protein TatA